jgi:hypothetical protein
MQLEFSIDLMQIQGSPISRHNGNAATATAALLLLHES